MVALDIYIEELLQVLDTDEVLKFLPEELDFDVDELLADIHAFLGKENSAVVFTSIATKTINHFSGDEHNGNDPRGPEDKHGKQEGISQQGKCLSKVVDTTFARGRKRPKSKEFVQNEVRVGFQRCDRWKHGHLERGILGIGEQALAVETFGCDAVWRPRPTDALAPTRVFDDGGYRFIEVFSCNNFISSFRDLF